MNFGGISKIFFFVSFLIISVLIFNPNVCGNTVWGDFVYFLSVGGGVGGPKFSF